MDQTYTSNGFATIELETDVDGLVVEGEWPTDIRGTLYRIGPNPQFEPIEPYNPLLGDGVGHAFSIGEHRVSCKNRWIKTQQWQAENQAGRALFATSGNPMQLDPSVRSMKTDCVAYTNVCWHGGRLLALEEAHPLSNWIRLRSKPRVCGTLTTCCPVT